MSAGMQHLARGTCPVSKWVCLSFAIISWDKNFGMLSEKHMLQLGMNTRRA